MQIILFWILRRFLELGGILGTGLTFWNSLPPDAQHAVLMLLNANWQEITVGALIPVAVAIGGYVWSFISTIRPQIVVDGKQVPTKKLPSQKKNMVEEVARTEIQRKPRTIFDVIAQRFGF